MLRVHTKDFRDVFSWMNVQAYAAAWDAPKPTPETSMFWHKTKGRQA